MSNIKTLDSFIDDLNFSTNGAKSGWINCADFDVGIFYINLGDGGASFDAFLDIEAASLGNESLPSRIKRDAYIVHGNLLDSGNNEGTNHLVGAGAVNLAYIVKTLPELIRFNLTVTGGGSPTQVTSSRYLLRF